MKAIALTPKDGRLSLVDVREPAIEKDDEIKVRLVRVGICGTDRDEVSGGRVRTPAGRDDIVLGHEMLGRVTETGKAVTRVSPGDYAVFTVRRGCGECLPCGMNRSDMCLTGRYTERGIWGHDGYQAEFAVDTEQYVVRVPDELAGVGVLTEPLAVAEKALDETLRVQFARLPAAPAHMDWFHGRKCLVAGLGPIGLLASLALVLRGADVFGLDIVDPGTPRPMWLAAIGGRYVDGRKVPADSVAGKLGSMDVIFDATGIAKLEFSLLDALARNGVYVVTGIPVGDRPIEIQGSELMSRLVLNNQVMIGSVNDSRSHFQMAVDDLHHAYLRWGKKIAELITDRLPYTSFGDVFVHHKPDEIKVVIEWAAANGGTEA